MAYKSFIKVERQSVGFDANFILGSNKAPDANDLSPGQMGLWFDPTNGSAALKSTGKSLDGTLFTYSLTGGGGGGVPAGSTGQIQFNAGGSPNVFGANPGLSWYATSKILSVGKSGRAMNLQVVSTPGGGATGYEYYVIVNFSDGTTTGNFEDGTWAFFSDGPAVLDASHYNQLTWTDIPGAVSYSIYTDERDGTPSSLGLLAIVLQGVGSFRDDGVAGDGNAVYPDNTTGFLSIANPLAAPLSVGPLLSSVFGNVPALGVVYRLDSDSRYDGALRSTLNIGVDNTTGTFGGAISTLFNSSGVTIAGGQAHYYHTYVKNVTGSMIGAYHQYDVYGTSPGAFGTHQPNSVVWVGVNVPGGNVGFVSAYHADSPFTEPFGLVGHIDTYVAFWSGPIRDVSNPNSVTNGYHSWFDGAGVRRVKHDESFDSVGQAIEALYNPQFTKYTPGATDYERVILGQWNGNVAEIGTEKGGTGTLRDLRLIGGNIHTDGRLITDALTVATLPATPVAGQRAFVTDSNAVSFTAGIGAVVAAGGATKVPVTYDGTSWRIG